MIDIKNKFDLTGKVAIVTGASDGIGKDLALGLAQVGADVIVCARRESELKKVKAEIEAIGRQSEAFVFDVCNLKDIERLSEFTTRRFGHLDVLINVAGFVITKPAWEVSEEEWDQMVDVGLKGLYFCCQILGKLMKNRGYGKIINLSSTFAQSTAKGRAVYAGIKAAVSHLTEALASEWAADGIRVNALAPTAVLTPSRQELLQGDRLKMIVSRIPLGRVATTDDLMGAAIFLASEASDFVTGHTLFVDGGLIAAS